MRFVARIVAVAMVAGVLLVGSPADAATRPTAPRAAKATALNQAVKVAWLRPASTGGAPIDRYVVQRWNPTTQKWRSVRALGGRTLAWTNTGLLNGTTYYYRVLAHNRVGWSPASRQVAALPRAVPGGVPGLEADTWDSELRARWGNAAANGSPVDHYQAQISTDGATWTTTRKVTSLAVAYPGLTPGTRYWLRVRAHNAAGYGPYGGAGPYRAYTVPDAVRALTVTRGDGEAVLDWDAPLADIATGRPAATDYRVEMSADDGATWTVTDTTTATTATVTDLMVGATYLFRVSARPSIPNIGYGPAVPVSTAPALPGQPTDLTATPSDTGGSWQVALTWVAPTDGDAVASYRLERSTDGGMTWTELTELTDLADLSYVDTTVAPASTYDYRVIAVGIHGSGEPSLPATTTTGEPEPDPEPDPGQRP